ncbi:alpha/beta fold hydrolase [Octadecabacter ascidiaceicola]|uniref:Carboxylesterase YbfK n=1 Tax=Octadecabacter ascidiaceicola TaxID=1655543 RepID=A0A238KHZ8_9RHOB|nr:alpha/beta hydrolase [Octadecabacter ascidiaceicola]SMX42433.1 Carboxylesterase YbfK [Octadecabacter ascidiaceicola]
MTLTTLRLSKSGTTIAHSDHGAGEPVVLLHGVGMQSAAWGPQIDALQSDYRVLAVDLPGHGDSDPLPPTSALPAYVEWLDDVVSTFDLGPINLAGHSMGALIAAGYAVSFPEMTRRVALLNGVYRRDAAAHAAVVARAAEICHGKIDIETPLTRWFGTSATDVTARAKGSEWLNAVDPEAYGTAYSAFASGDRTYADKLSQIACPFLALTGDGDRNSTPEMSQAMAAQAQDGRAVVIEEGHRHMVNLTAPAQVNAQLIAWLKRPETRLEKL